MRFAPAAGLVLIALAGFLALEAGRGISTGAAQGVTTVTVGDYFFCDPSLPVGGCETIVSLGDTIVWEYAGGDVTHTVTHCANSCDSPTDSPLWDSDFLVPGESFSFTFDTPGTFFYSCKIHPFDMRATIVVQAEETPTTTSMPEPAFTPTTAATSTPTSAPPNATPTTLAQLTMTPAVRPAPPVGNSHDDGRVASLWFILVGIGGAAALAGGAFFVWRSRRAR